MKRLIPIRNGLLNGLRNGLLAIFVVFSASTQTTSVEAADVPEKIKQLSEQATSKLKQVTRKAAYYAKGVASYYGKAFHGRRTASGKRFDMHAMTGAHRTLPLNSMVRVTNLENGRSVVVRITDRGPFTRNRLIDLSYGAAKQLGMVSDGTAKVEVTRLDADPLFSAWAGVAQAEHVPDLFLDLGQYANHEAGDRVRLQLAAAEIQPLVLRPLSVATQTGTVQLLLGPLADMQAADHWLEKLSAQGFRDVGIVLDASLQDTTSVPLVGPPAPAKL